MSGAEKVLRGGLPFVLLVGLGAACTGNGEKKLLCSSPPAVSDLYPGDKTEGVTDSQSTWRLGAIITDRTVIQDTAKYNGLVIGFSPASTPGDVHNEKMSEPVRPPSKRILVTIGPDEVVFTARKQATEGSPDCNTAPIVEFGMPQTFEEIFPGGRPAPDLVKPDWP